MLPLVLYTGATPWGSNRTLADLLGEPAAFHVFAPSWQPLFWNLADQTAEGLLASGEEWLQALAVIRAQGEEAATFEAVYTEAVRRLQALHGRDHVRWYDLMRIVLTWATWRRPAPERATLLTAAQASPADPAHQKEIQTMTQTIAQAIFAEGRVEGRVEGEAKGEAKGALQASRKLLRRLLEDRFGALPEAVSQRIEATTDLDRLEAAVLQVSRLQSLDDLQL